MDIEEEPTVDSDNIDPSEVDDYSELPSNHPLYVEGIDDEDDEIPEETEVLIKAVGLLVGLGALVTLGVAIFVAYSSYSALIF